MAKKTSRQTQTSEKIDSLRKLGEQAKAAYDYPLAVEHFTQALELLTVFAPDPVLEFDLLFLRLACYDLLGEHLDHKEDVDRLLLLAGALNNLDLKAKALLWEATYQAGVGQVERAIAASEQVIALGIQADRPDLEADGLVAMAGFNVIKNESDAHMEACLLRALDLYRQMQRNQDIGICNKLLGTLYINMGRAGQGRQFLNQALMIFRTHGDRLNEALTLNNLSLGSLDLAEKRWFQEQALEICISIHAIREIAVMYNNLGLLYGNLGLYKTSQEYGEQAVAAARAKNAVWALAIFSESLGRAYRENGMPEAAQRSFTECLELAGQMDDHWLIGEASIGLGRIALAAGRLEEADESLRYACDELGKINLLSDQVNALAWHGAVYVSMGQIQKALETTEEAVRILAGIDRPISEYPAQEIWWWRFQAMRAAQESGLIQGDDYHTEIEHVLEMAYRVMLAGIEALSDAGLRRNYLNKVSINRQILPAWNAQRAQGGLPVEPPVGPAGNLQESFRRLLAIGAQMNAPRPLQELLDFIVTQVIELSGAERLLLAFRDGKDAWQAAASFGYREDIQAVLVEHRSLLDDLAAAPRPLLDEVAGISRMAVPLGAGSRPEVLLVETDAVFGPFDESDLDLLVAFAQLAAAALQNARLVEGLEMRVADRTEALQTSNAGLVQRNAELAVINRIQQGLASELDMDAIIHLVGDELQQIFGVSEIEIATYDELSGMVSIPYWSTSKGHVYQDALPLGRGLMSHIIQTGQAVIMTDENREELLAKAVVPEGLQHRRSFIGAPIISSRGVVGAISLHEPHQENAYSTDQLSLLTTIAASLGTALENARLFAEVQQRNLEISEALEQQTATNAVLRAMSAYQPDLRSLLEIIALNAAKVCGADDAHIYRIDGGELKEWNHRGPIPGLEFRRVAASLIVSR